jgi:hypothetical protein
VSPETWEGIGTAVAGALVLLGGQRGFALVQRRRNGNGNGNGHDGHVLTLLREIKHEVTDRDGSVRSHGHDIRDALQVGIGRLELLQAHDARVEKHLEKIAEVLTAIRIEAAERGNCCAHCAN